MANAATKVRDIFQLTQRPMTLTEIRQAQPDLKASQISMALCYFMKQRYMTREQIKNEQSPNDSKSHSNKRVVKNREKCIRTGDESHKGSEENRGANTHIFGLFAFGATFQQGFVGSGTEDEKLF